MAYYYNLKPEEFWELELKSINLFIEMSMLKEVEDFKRNVVLEEAVTNKLIRADSMNKKAKVIPLKTMFKKLFKNDETKIKYQSPAEQIERLRNLR